MQYPHSPNIDYLNAGVVCHEIESVNSAFCTSYAKDKNNIAQRMIVDTRLVGQQDDKNIEGYIDDVGLILFRAAPILRGRTAKPFLTSSE